MEMKRVLSSHVMELGYDQDEKILAVRYAPTLKNPEGRLVEHLGVEPEVASEVLSSPSVGAALHRMIRGQYKTG